MARTPSPVRLRQEVLFGEDAARAGELLALLDAKEARVRYGASRALRLASASSPAALAPHFGAFALLLDSPRTILRWEAIAILANLAAVDRDGRLAALLDRLYRPLRGPVLITAANLAAAGAIIARAQPRLADRLARKLMTVERGRYQTEECRHVVIGGAIQALNQFADLLGNRDHAAVLRFVRRHADDPRPGTAKQAARFLKKWDTPSAAETRRTRAQSAAQ